MTYEYEGKTEKEAIEKVKAENPILLKGYTDEVIATLFAPYYTITFWL